MVGVVRRGRYLSSEEDEDGCEEDGVIICAEGKQLVADSGM